MKEQLVRTSYCLLQIPSPASLHQISFKRSSSCEYFICIHNVTVLLILPGIDLSHQFSIISSVEVLLASSTVVELKEWVCLIKQTVTTYLQAEVTHFLSFFGCKRVNHADESGDFLKVVLSEDIVFLHVCYKEDEWTHTGWEIVFDDALVLNSWFVNGSPC